MAIIQAKKRAIIQKGAGYSYNPDTFEKEHAIENFYATDDATYILQHIQPMVLFERKFISFDTETHPYFIDSQAVPEGVVRRWVGTGKAAVPQDYPFCISICDGKNAYTLYDSIENNFAEMRKLAPLFDDASIEKIAHNWKFDAHMFANASMRIVGRVHDTVVLAKLVNENRHSFELKELAAKKKDGIVKFEYMVDTYKQMHKVKDYRHIPRPLMTQYANADVWNCIKVFADEYPKLLEDDLGPLYDKECEDMIALYAMERHGMKVNPAYEAGLKSDLQKLTDDAEKAIYEEAGCMFNINSGKQLYNVLLTLGVNENWVNMTDKGNPKLDKDALDMLADKYDVSIVKKILEYRKYEKLLNTYAIGIYAQRDMYDRVHCSINQTEATTGRMSITKPALQTLPKKDKRIRGAFIPDDGYTLYFMDLDQVEYRLFAHYAKIPSLIKAIENGYDVHAATAAIIFHEDLDNLLYSLRRFEDLSSDKEANAAELAELSKYVDMRSKGKTINFALIYGVGIEHLSVLLKCTSTEATNLKVSYFAQLPEAKTFINTVYAVINQRGFVKNFYGRKRRLDSDDCYKAPNALVQGCAADYIKDKIINLYKYLRYNKLLTRLVLPVHDEIILNVHNSELKHLPILRWLMSDFEAFRCPITAGIEKGNVSWGQKVFVGDVGFEEPADKSYLSYDVYDGSVFNKEDYVCQK